MTNDNPSRNEGATYSIKEVIAMIKNDWKEMSTELRQELHLVKSEMQETREAVRKYNGLHEKLARARQENADTKKAVDEIIKIQAACMSAKKERSSVGKGIREWGGWLMSVVMFLITLWALTKGG